MGISGFGLVEARLAIHYALILKLLIVRLGWVVWAVLLLRHVEALGTNVRLLRSVQLLGEIIGVVGLLDRHLVVVDLREGRVIRHWLLVDWGEVLDVLERLLLGEIVDLFGVVVKLLHFIREVSPPGYWGRLLLVVEVSEGVEWVAVQVLGRGKLVVEYGNRGDEPISEQDPVLAGEILVDAEGGPSDVCHSPLAVLFEIVVERVVDGPLDVPLRDRGVIVGEVVVFWT